MNSQKDKSVSLEALDESWACHVVQRRWWLINFIRTNLTKVAFSNMFEAVIFHCAPIIPLSQIVRASINLLM